MRIEATDMFIIIMRMHLTTSKVKRSEKMCSKMFIKECDYALKPIKRKA